MGFLDVYSKTIRLRNFKPGIHHSLGQGQNPIHFQAAILGFEVWPFPEVFLKKNILVQFFKDLVQVIIVVVDRTLSLVIVRQPPFKVIDIQKVTCQRTLASCRPFSPKLLGLSSSYLVYITA